MASQRRAPTKRPPRPAAKKPPPPPSAEGTDSAERVSKTATPGAAPAKAAATTTPAATGDGPASGTAGPTSTAGPKSAGTTATKGPTTAKAAPSGGVPKTNAGGPNYRPPTGASRTRRPPPPPKRKKPKFTKKTIGAVVALALIGSLVVFFSLAVNGSSSNTAVNTALSGPEQVPIPSGPVLAAVDSARYPSAIDGITCDTSEQLKYHIHAHLAIFVDGQPRQVPYGIGIAPPQQYSTSNGTFVSGGSCFYWLHTHAADGIMHIESPTQTIYTLGQFFDMWGQPLMAGQVGPAIGPVKAYVNGKLHTGDPKTIPLNAHDQIQLDVGSSPPAPITVTFPNGL